MTDDKLSQATLQPPQPRPGRGEVQRRGTLAASVSLCEVADGDLEILFRQQLDKEANHMAAFTKEDPSDREAFMAHRAKVRAHSGVTIRAVEVGGALAGSILVHDWFGEPGLAGANNNIVATTITAAHRIDYSSTSSASGSPSVSNING
jgi:hypothetical protein